MVARMLSRTAEGNREAPLLVLATEGVGALPTAWQTDVRRKEGKKKILVVAGPTGVGKSKIATLLGAMLGGEILSADSMQVYRGMDIGTAKPDVEERARVPHHLIDIREIGQPFNVAHFYQEAKRALKKIFSLGAVPIVVGGTGFYIRALIYGPPSGPPSVPKIRQQLEKEMAEVGSAPLYARLKNVDPEYASRITGNDRQKIVRALEIIAITGLKVTEFTESSPEQTMDYDFSCWFLYRPLPVLYARIEQRCDAMLACGLSEEVRALARQGLRDNPSAAQAIGYRQFLEYFTTAQTERDWEKSVADFKTASRRYVKRQLTWFRKEPLFRWLDIDVLGEEATAEMIAQDYELR